jgi:hypothetical protein
MCHVASHKLTDVSDVLTASITRGDDPDDDGNKHLWKVRQFLEITRRCIPQDSHIHISRRENLRSQLETVL